MKLTRVNNKAIILHLIADCLLFRSKVCYFCVRKASCVKTVKTIIIIIGQRGGQTK